jgi:hypothetical protein
MKRAPGRADIDAAELRLVQSRRATLDGLRRAKSALSETLAQATTLAWIAGAVGLLVFWRARAHRRKNLLANSQPSVSAEEKIVAPTPSLFGIVMALVMRYGMQGLSFMLEQARLARQKRAERTEVGVSNLPATTRYPRQV